MAVIFDFANRAPGRNLKQVAMRPMTRGTAGGLS